MNDPHGVGEWGGPSANMIVLENICFNCNFWRGQNKGTPSFDETGECVLGTKFTVNTKYRTGTMAPSFGSTAWFEASTAATSIPPWERRRTRWDHTCEHFHREDPFAEMFQ